MVFIRPVAELVTQDRLKQVIEYNSTTGVFRWLRIPENRAVAGKYAAVSKDHYGYGNIVVDGRSYKAHRLAWLYVYGAHPTNEIDHVNRDAGDNRIVNLREATRKQNMENLSIRQDNQSLEKGVGYVKLTGKYRARIRHNGSTLVLGTFSTLGEASDAYSRASQELFTHRYVP